MTLSNLCRLFLPRASDTELLRVCLWRDKAAVQDAFAAWSLSPEYSGIQAGTGGKRRMLPLLNAALLRADVAPPPDLRALLRASQIYENLRAGTYAEIAACALKNLRAAGIPFLATGGASLAIRLYAEDEARHCHDIDLLLNEESIAAATEVLELHCDFTMKKPPPDTQQDWVMHHVSGLPIILHSRSHRMPAYQISWAGLQQQAALQSAYGTEFFTLSPEDSFLHLVFLAATASQSSSLIWVVDAYKLVADGRMNWERLAEQTKDRAGLIPLLYTLEYLSEGLRAPVPPGVIDELRSGLKKWSAAERLQAEKTMVYGLQRSLGIGRKALLAQARGWRLRLWLLNFFLFPDAATLLSAGEVQSAREVPGFWARRVGRGLPRWLRHQLRGRDGWRAPIAKKQDESR